MILTLERTFFNLNGNFYISENLLQMRINFPKNNRFYEI